MKYVIISDYYTPKHSIVETFIVSSKTALKKKLGMILDAYADYPGDIPKEPDPEMIRVNLIKYATEDQIKSEIKRMQKMWKGYNHLMSNVDDGVDAEFEIDKKWTVIVKIND